MLSGTLAAPKLGLLLLLMCTLAESLASSASAAAAATTPTSTSSSNSGSSSAASTSGFQSSGARTLLRIYDECARTDAGLVPCLKKKAISFIDRIEQIEAISVADGVKLVRLPAATIHGQASPFSQRAWTNENELESALPRSGEERDLLLTNILVERLSRFFNGHSLQVSFPKLSTDEIGRGLEEGRGKMKKMMSMMMMGMAMKMMGMIPLAMGALYILAGKALIISKIALLLAGIIGLKKLMSGRGGSGGGGGGGWSAGGGGGGWSSGGGGGSGGWDRRSFNEAHDLAYRSYSRQHQAQAQAQAQTQVQAQAQQVQHS